MNKEEWNEYLWQVIKYYANWFFLYMFAMSFFIAFLATIWFGIEYYVLEKEESFWLMIKLGISTICNYFLAKLFGKWVR